MALRSDSSAGARGLSVRQITFLFLGAVAVCAIFFALGFLVGSNGRSATSGAPTAEQVSPPSEIPPTVNPPLQTSEPAQSSSSSQHADVIEQDLKSTATPPSPPASAAVSSSPARSPEPRLAETARPSVPRGAIMVQVAAMHTAQDARSLVTGLKGRGYHAFLVTPQQAGRHDQLYRVQVGPFASRDQAMKTLQKLSGEGFNPFIRE